MRSLLFAVIALIGALCTEAAVAAPAPFDLDRPEAALDLRGALTPYHASGDGEADGSRWYITTISNPSLRPLTRVLIADEPADAMVRIWQHDTRARILQVASSDGGVAIVRENALGSHAYRITVPPQTGAALAIRLLNTDDPPSVLAWSEPALVAYHRQLAIFIAAVGGLIASAAAITAGLAAMTRHAAARWAAWTLAGLFFLWLAATGLVERAMTVPLGGPYGLIAFLEGMTLVAALKLTGAAAPFSDVWAEYGNYRGFIIFGMLGLSALALAGVPGTALLVSIATVFGVAGLAAYLVRRGAEGSRAARVLAPSAAVFALVTLAAALAAVGIFHGNPLAAKMVGGFAAAGAVLVALAVSAGEGLGLMGAPPLHQRVAALAASRAAAPPLLPAAERTAPLPARAIPAAIAAIGASHQGVFELDFPADTLHLSAEGAVLIGLPPAPRAFAHAQFIGRVHPDDRGVYKQALSDYRAHPGLAFRIEFRVKSEGGRYPWFELRATMVGEGAAADKCLGLMADVTTRKEAEAAAFDRSLKDTLTGLGNRVALMEALERLGRRPRAAALAVLDIDRFKAIHDSLGDAGADAVLRHVAERLVKRYRGAAETYRIGGDAFALLFAQRGAESAMIGDELVELGGAALTENSRRIFAPASIGIARGADCDEPIDLLSNAELALRAAKHAGGGCARVYSAELEGTAPHDSVALEAELRRALEEGQIDLFYQPVMRLSDRVVAGFEALLRWHHPERGMVWPSDFIGHSEESGLIVVLGRFALARAAEDLARWQRYFPVTPPIFVSINVSRRQLQDERLEADLAAVLAAHPLAPRSLRLEITESAIAAGGDAAAKLSALKGQGVGLAIDDFGTGLSSLSQLKELPFDTLKVDRSFLARGRENGDAPGDETVILASIVALAQELGRAIIVEGVESEDDAQRLAAMGCGYAQGFLFSVPLPAREALNFIALHYDAAGAKSEAG